MFSLNNVPVPQLTPIGRPISGEFKYRVLAFNADTPLEKVAQMYGHRKSEVTQFKESLERKHTFIVCQVWDAEAGAYKQM